MKDLPKTLPQNRVKQSFRRGLKTYHESASHQADIAAQLAHLIAQHAPKHLGKVLEFGVGTGHLTNQLVSRFSVDDLYLNDLVAECEGFAPGTATFLTGAIETLPYPTDLDLICSASTVQWLEDLPTTLARLTDALTKGGQLALSGFGSAQFHELRTLGSAAAAPSYVDAEDWRLILPQGLKIKHLSQARRVEWFPNAMALLKHLRDTGVNGAASQNWTARDLKDFETRYRQRFGTPRGLPLTYDPVWVIAQKA